MRDQPTPEIILETALEIDGQQERSAYLGEACGCDESLREEVGSLIAAHLAAETFMISAAEPLGREFRGEKEGDLIGRYKLLQQIGEGGFGTVYLADQSTPVKRQVALKIIKPGMDSREIIARFEAERQVLALMDHPHIAKVHDAGTTEGGRPYFVMQLVKGEADHQILRPERPRYKTAAGAFHRRLRGRATRAPEGHHPPRSETV